MKKLTALLLVGAGCFFFGNSLLAEEPTEEPPGSELTSAGDEDPAPETPEPTKLFKKKGGGCGCGKGK